MIPKCLLCNDIGVVTREKDGQWYGSLCHCVEQKSIECMIQASGLSGDERSIRFEQFEVTRQTEKMNQVVQLYLMEFPEIFRSRTASKGMALTGYVGTGKTMLVQAVANELLDRKIPVIFVVTPALIGELRAAQFNASGQEIEEKILTLSTVDVAIFDDVAKEKISEWVQTQYFRIVDNRYRRRLPTIFTSNHNIDGISQRLGDAVASRLYDLTKGRQVWCEADDYRLRKTILTKASANERV